MKAKVILIILLLFFKTSLSFSQSSEKEAIKKVIYQLFEGFEKNDTNIVATTLHEKVRFKAIDLTKNPTMISESNYQKIMAGVAKPKSASEIWQEIPSKFKIKIDNQMANVWVNYKFYIGGKYSHKGIDNFILYKEKNQWKIIFLSYTRR